MGRRKIEIKAIKDDRNRSVTFLKRKGGLFKKAHELSVLCQVDVAVIIFGHNKKLYEFSSGDINETIGRFQYYGGAHEHKGPEDFMGKQDGDEDEDVDEPMEHMNSHSPPDQPMMAHHLQHQPAFQHMRHPTPSASPPIPNGNQFQRGASPMPHGISRPNSAMHVRRTSSNLVPQQHHAASHPPPQGNYAYMPNPPIYNPQAAAGMQMRGPPGPPQPPQQAPQVQPPPQYPYNQPPPHPQMQHVMQQEQRRQSMPPQYPPHERPTSVPVPSPPQPPPHQLPPQQQQRHQRQPSQPPQQQPQQQQQQHQQQNFQSPPMPQPKPLPAAAKSHSIFTPIDDSRSLLAQHWNSTSTAEPPRSEPAFMQEGPPRAQTIDTASISRAQINGRSPQPPHHAQLPPQPSQVNRTNSVPSIPGINPPSRTNSMQTDAKRPRLKVQIPSEQSDGGEETANSSSKDTTAGAPQPAPVKGEPGNASGVVLPPPSPSASALLSAGATGPPNPFARPAPPVNNGSFGNRSDMETPISALPSRFVSDNLLPSPSSYYPEWYGRDTNILPSPLTFQTPVVTNGPSFRDDSDDRKRKSSDGSENGPGKRLKG